MGIPFGYGMQMLLDGQQNYVRSGLVCYLRVENFAPEGDWQEVGVPYVPTGAAAAQTGFTDLLISPPPEVRDVSMHNIGMSGGRLQFGARYFIISNTFVENIMQRYPNISDPFNVWQNWDAELVNGNWENATASVIGIIYENRMHSIEDISHVEIAGQTIKWKLTTNRHETPLEVPANEEENV
jgi:hypothetical protein